MISKTFLRKFTTSNVGGLLNPTHPRYSGVRTLLRAPYESDLKKVDIGLIGVPFGKRFFFFKTRNDKKKYSCGSTQTDGGVTNRPGARYVFIISSHDI